MPARALVFDFNGTLSDDEPLMCAIYEEMFAREGRPLTPARYYAELAGNTEEAIIGGWLDVAGSELDRLVEERVARYRAIASDGSTVRSPVREAVRHAAARVPVAVVSGAFRAEIEPVLAAAGLAELFTAVVSADDVAHGKPDPAGYELALSLLGDLAPHDVVAFEDTEAGIASAKAAGLRCIAVQGTLPDERLAQADELVPAVDVALVARVLA
jgi:HAD superfamily hydrolase (TIGR01509 family)